MDILAEVAQDKVAKPPAAKARVSLQRFLRSTEGRLAEWVDGEVVEMAPIGEEHDRLDAFLIRLFGEFLERHPVGEIRHDPFNMKTGPGLPGRAPDILFVAKKNLRRLKKTHLAGPADLAVEIVSRGSRAIDRGHRQCQLC